MSLDTWIVTSFGAAFSIMLGISAYFIKLWMQEVDGNLKEHSKDIKAFGKQISALEQAQALATKSISETIRKEHSNGRIPYERLDELKNEVSFLNSVIKDNVIPNMERTNENLGKIILIEKRVSEQETKMIKLFDIVKLAVLKPTQNQK